MVSTTQGKCQTQSLVRSCFIRFSTFCSDTPVLSLAQKVRSVTVGHTCGHMDVQVVRYSLVLLMR